MNETTRLVDAARVERLAGTLERLHALHAAAIERLHNPQLRAHAAERAATIAIVEQVIAGTEQLLAIAEHLAERGGS
jgi:hypothetical protein